MWTCFKQTNEKNEVKQPQENLDEPKRKEDENPISLGALQDAPPVVKSPRRL